MGPYFGNVTSLLLDFLLRKSNQIHPLELNIGQLFRYKSMFHLQNALVDTKCDTNHRYYGEARVRSVNVETVNVNASLTT